MLRARRPPPPPPPVPPSRWTAGLHVPSTSRPASTKMAPYIQTPSLACGVRSVVCGGCTNKHHAWSRVRFLPGNEPSPGRYLGHAMGRWMLLPCQ